MSINDVIVVTDPNIHLHESTTVVQVGFMDLNLVTISDHAPLGPS